MCRKVLSFCFFAFGIAIALGASAIFKDAPSSQDEDSAQWSHWAGWSPCSKTCGFGDNFRARTCTDPSPKSLAKGCIGANTEIAHCYRGPCLGPEVKGVVFNGKSYQNYAIHDFPLRYLVIFMHFKPLTSDGTLLHRFSLCDSSKCHREVIVDIVKNRIQLTVNDLAFSVSLMTLNSIRIGEWQTLLVQVTRRMAIVRLDDKRRIQAKMHVAENVEVDFDSDMILGARKDSSNGFVGTILKLRLNFKDLSFLHTPGWVGFGAPVKQEGISIEKTNSAESHTRFLGKYSAKIHFKKHNLLLLKLTIYLMDTEGVILFNEGAEPGSYMSLSLHNAALRFCLGLGDKASCQKAIILQTERWYYLSILISKNHGELRVDKGRAIQLTAIGINYLPKTTLFLGGGQKQDWNVISKLTRQDQGFDGVVNEIFINGKIFPFKQAVLVDKEGRVNSDGYSLSAHVSEVYETPTSKVTMRCDATLFARQGGLVTTDWIETDKLVKPNTHVKIIPQIPGNPYESALVLEPGTPHDGIYACIVNHDGVRTITHTFPILLHHSNHPIGYVGEFLGRILLTMACLLILTCCCLCISCCCCKKKTSDTIKMAPVVPRRPSLKQLPSLKLLPDVEKIPSLNNIEKGESDLHIYTDLDGSGREVSESGREVSESGRDVSETDGTQRDGLESARTDETKETNDSESDSKDEKAEEREEMLEKASRVLELIGSIDNLKTVVTRLSQEQMRQPQDLSSFDEEEEQNMRRRSPSRTGSRPLSPSRHGSRYSEAPPPARLSHHDDYM